MKRVVIAALLLFCMASFVLADVDISQINGENFENGTQVVFTEAVNNSFVVQASSDATNNISYDLNNEPQDMIIDENGRISWLVPPGQLSVDGIEVIVTEDDAGGDVEVKTFNAAIKPVLEIVSVQLASLGNNLQVVEDGEAFDGFFRPGQNGTLRVNVKNNFVAGGQNIIERLDVDETIEAITLTIDDGEILAQEQRIVNEDDNNGELLFARAQHTLPIIIKFQVPLDQEEGNVPFMFTVEGQDKDVPAHSYTSEYEIVFPVRQASHDVQITDFELQEEVTCEQKQDDVDLTVELTNTGLEANELVTVKVLDGNELIHREDVVMNAQNRVQEVELGLNLINLTGQKELTVQTSRANQFDLPPYDSQVVQTTIANCAPVFTNRAQNDSLDLDEDTVTEFTISDLVENAEETQNLAVEVSEVDENINVVVSGDKIIITPAENYFTPVGGEFISFRMTANDGSGEVSQIINVEVIQNRDDDSISISQVQPSTATTVNLNSNIDEANSQEFTITIDNPDNRQLGIAWFVAQEDENEVNQNDNDESFTFNANNAENGNYVVKVTVSYQDENQQNQELTQQWNVAVTDVPIGFDSFSGDETTSEFDDINNVDLVLENNNGKIEWQNNVDISQIQDISSVVKVENSQVRVDSDNAPDLNEAATITLAKSFTNPIILRSDEFDNPNFDETCPENVCEIIENANGQVRFTVTGFSAYQVQEEQAASLEVASEVTQSDVVRGQEITFNVTVKNVGTSEALSSVDTNLNVEAKYNARQVQDLPNQIAANAQHTYQFALTVPESEDGGKQRIGTLEITSDQSNKTVSLFIEPQSFLEITDIDIEGNDLRIDEEFDIDVDVQNNLDIDIEDVEVECIIKDIDDGDDEEENAEDEEDIRAGKDETFTCTFDLSRTDIEDDDTFTIEIIADGRDEDGVRHSVTQTTTASLDLEKDEVVIEDLSLSPNVLTCNANTNLEVRYKNMGSRDQDDMVLRVRNSELGLDLSRSDLELDEFTGRDNDDTESFNINVPGASAGSYLLEVSLYLDEDDLEDTKTVELTVNECGSTRTQTQAQEAFTTQDYASELQAQLNSQLQSGVFGQAAPATQEQAATVRASFRDSQTYLILIGALVFLGFIALVLAIVVLASKPKGRRR